MIALAAAAYLLLAVIARLAAWLSSTTDPAIGNGAILMLAAGMLWVSPSSAFRCLLLAFAIPAVCLILLRLAGDRKSVVLGKSVSVRVDLGCRRIIKKKKK